MKNCAFIVLLFAVAALGPDWLVRQARAADVLRISKPRSEQDPRREYHRHLLELILEETRSDFGEYAIRHFEVDCSRARELHEMASGENINVCVVPTSAEWEARATAVRIPVMMGLLSYRLLLIDRDMEAVFDGLETAEDLKPLRAGFGCSWPITKVFKEQGFSVVATPGYEELFRMLEARRFDYLPRGVNDIFTEYAVRPELAARVAIQETLTLYIPMPVYIFISPAFPRIATRLETGFRRVLADGRFKDLFAEYHCSLLRLARLDQRRILSIDNPLLPPGAVLGGQGLWIAPEDPLALCR